MLRTFSATEGGRQYGRSAVAIVSEHLPGQIALARRARDRREQGFEAIQRTRRVMGDQE